MYHEKFQAIQSVGPRKGSGNNLTRFMKFVENKRNLKFSDYWDFHKWSTDCIDAFWADLWDFSGIIYSKPYDKVIDLSTPMQDIPSWFEGARLNIAENYLKYRDDHVALMEIGEGRDLEKLTYQQLYQETKIYAAALRKFGLKMGDIVTCYMSNRKEAVIAMLATSSIGAIWTGASPFLGSVAYLNRIKQLLPKVLFTEDKFTYNKQDVNLLENAKDIVDGLPSLEMVIIVPSTPKTKEKDITNIRNSNFLDDFLKTAYFADGSVPELIFEQVAFSHPIFINFTSGTTGLPKCLVHGMGGILSSMRDFSLHWDADRNDVILTGSPVGWVAWNIFVNCLFIGSTIVLFNGNPCIISPAYAWDIIDELKLTILSISPNILDQMEKKRCLPDKKHHLRSLRFMIAGSSTVKPNNFDFVNNNIKKDVLEILFGCTEMMSYHIVTEPTIPLYKGEISSPTLGTALEILNESGIPVMGEIGEVVLAKPVPSLPIGVWGDTSGKTYKDTYFAKYPGKFSTADLAIINPTTRGIIPCGRREEALKTKHIRFASSEIYSIVVTFPEIQDSLCVAQFSKDGLEQRVILFIKMCEGQTLNVNLIQRLQQAILIELTEDHIPAVILETPAIPYNVNGKKMEITVKGIINKLPANVESVINKECLKFFYDIPELQDY